MTKHPDQRMYIATRVLDQVASTKDLQQAHGLVQETELDCLDLPVTPVLVAGQMQAQVGQLTNHELRVDMDRHAVVARTPACSLDPAYQILERGDEGPVLGFVAEYRLRRPCRFLCGVGHTAAEIKPDRLPLAGSRFEAERTVSGAIGGSLP